MLVLTRKPGESIFLGEAIKVTMVQVRGKQVRIAIDCPRELAIWRAELAPETVVGGQRAVGSAP